jgi:hypothetical protein
MRKALAAILAIGLFADVVETGPVALVEAP